MFCFIIHNGFQDIKHSEIPISSYIPRVLLCKNNKYLYNIGERSVLSVLFTLFTVIIYGCMFLSHLFSLSEITYIHILCSCVRKSRGPVARYERGFTVCVGSQVPK